MLKELRERLKALLEARAAITAKAVDEKRGLTQEEKDARSAKGDEIEALEARIAEVADQEARESAAAAARVQDGETGEQRTSDTSVKDAPVYVPSGLNGHSFFRDLAQAQLGRVDRAATDRLTRNNKMVAAEQRALGNTNTTGGSGGEFAPPTWLVDEYIALARPARATADLFKKGDVPAGTSSISIPKVLTGTSVAIQSTQNTALSQTDLTTGSVSTGFTTLGGKEVVSQQIIDQAALPFDRVVLGDLAAAYAAQVGAQIYAGAGTGSNNNSVLNGLNNASVAAANQITYTTGSPTAAGFYSKAAGMLAAFVTNRYMMPTHWLMHPRRWYWLLAQVDSSNRPLVVPKDVAFNPMASDSNDTTVQGEAGVFLSLPVIIDPNVPTNLGAGTNQDEIFLVKADDLWLFESPVQTEAFRETYADTLGVLFRLYAYAGTILNRYNTSIATMNGTGLVAPTF